MQSFVSYIYELMCSIILSHFIDGPEEAGLFYTPHPEEDKRLGTVGHVRMDFGRSGNEFWHTWWPRGPEELNSPVFKAELQEVVDTLRESVLKSRFAMERHPLGALGRFDPPAPVYAASQTPPAAPTERTPATR